ncbi:DUF7289 family protein [Halorientalis litorea]|uniref:DUF7289 family protein n=1 Tax=Halorientalis litorea TaxID=2931977 RepID=UPI001FF59215|nr:hypothetical protein [Halorientalis litorea]
MRGDERGVTSPLGYLLVISMVILAVTSIVVIGSSALGDTQSQSELRRAEHSMTLFDSRAAMVALGTSDSQTLDFGTDSGQFYTQPDYGWMAIKHVDYDNAGNTQEIYNESLGAMVYENENTRMAYQGGGVWRLDRDGAATMVSPPEFHYRQATLTLPVIRLLGETAGSGAPSVTVSSRQQARLLFPNQSASYNTLQSNFTNPVENGTIYVDVHSRYYEGWAQYFRQRTAGDVRTFHNNNTARIELVSLGGSIGRFQLPSDSGAGSQDVSAVATGHPIQNFNLTLEEGGNSNGESHWSLYSVTDKDEFEIHVEMDNGGGCRPLNLQYYYHNTSTGTYQEWSTNLDHTSSSAYQCTEDGNKIDELHLNLTSTTETVEYTDITVNGAASGKYCFASSIDNNSPDEPVTVDDHGTYDDQATNPEFNAGSDLTTGDTATLNWTTNHYISKLGQDFEFQVTDSQGASATNCEGNTNNNGGSQLVDEDLSFGVLDYAEAEGAQFITYLHVTENEVEVDFD